MIRAILAVITLWLWFSFPAQGHEGCADIIAAPTDRGGKPQKQDMAIVSSGRDEEIFHIYREYADVLFSKGGIVEQLGLANPPHVIEFMPSGQLSVLASMGRHPIPHFHDGSIIATSARSAAGVLEFVTPGEITAPECPVCRSFYSDTTSIKHQISVMNHVVGHNDFAAYSMYATSRPSDPIKESLELADLIVKLYQEHDHDEVSRWYQFLLSVADLQDLTRGTFDAPEKFDPKKAPAANAERIVHSRGGRNPYPTASHPTSPTPSVLQAFVANLPPTVPEWKREVARRFERIYRVYGFYTSNKIMNEGWATLMQELLPPYTKYSTSEDQVDLADLMQGVAFPSLSNPYWLGRECWRIIRKRFNSRPEIKDLSRLEQDKRFIEFAHKEIISFMNDYDFIRYALDDQWVFSHNLYIHRKVTNEEFDRTLPDPVPMADQRIVLSRDRDRIVNLIARKVADRRLQLPQILLHNFNGAGRGIVDLRHDVVDQVPLERFSAAQALFVISQILEKPVSLMTVKSSTWKTPATPERGRRFWPFPFPPPWAEPDIQISPIRIEVQPDGKISVFDVTKDGETQEAELTAELQEAVNDYKTDLDGASNPDLSAHDKQTYQPLLKEIIDSATHNGMHLVTHAPTAGHALLEYSSMVERRLLAALKAAAAGKLPVKRTKRGVRIKVLPTIPEFRLDQKVAEKLREKLPPSPIDEHVRTATFMEHLGAHTKTGDALPPNGDDNVDVGSGNRRPGDKFWGDPKGKGQGEGDPDDGDVEPDENDDHQPMDPSEVEVPLELYARAVLAELELPNLRRTNAGRSEIVEYHREGGIHRPHGNILWERTVPAAINHAIEARRKKGLPYRGIARNVLLKEGLRYLQPSDYVVSDSEPRVLPDMKAIVVVVMDLTGSMTGRPQELSKEFVFNVEMLLKLIYKDVEFRFVGYDDAAHEFPRNKIFKAFLGGGNTDSTGYILAEKILKEYRDEEYNKYVIGIGDGGSYDMETHNVMKRLYKVCQYMGWVQTMVYGDSSWPGFVPPIKNMAESLPWFGYAQLEDSQSSVIKAIKQFFGKKPKKPAS